MWNVLHNEYFSLKYDNIKKRPCPRPPTVKMLIEAVSDELIEQNWRPLGITGNHLPDKEYLLTILSSIRPDHEFFAKDYKPPPRITKKKVNKGDLNSLAQLFEGMPKEDLKTIKKSSYKTHNRLLRI